MSTITKVEVGTREKRGSAEARRLRREGLVPGVIYGHGGDPISLSIPEDVITPLVFSGQKVIEADFGDRTQLGILRDLQWDTFGTKIVHFDLLRVNRDERVEVEVPVTLRGISPGVIAGGVLDQNLHTVSVECPTFAIPNDVEVKIGSLQIGDSIHVKALEFADGIKVLVPEEEVVLQIIEPMEVPEVGEEEDEAPAAVEPEVIGKEDDDEADDDDES